MSVLVVGGANYDLIAHGTRLPLEGETLVATGFHEAPGGKAANQAAAAARWGARTRFVGCIGDDGFGRSIVLDLEAAGVDVEHVRRLSDGTGLGMVFMDTHGRYATMVAPRANARLDAHVIAELPLEVWNDATVLCIALEAPHDALLAAARHAARQGLQIVINAAPADRLSSELDDVATVLVCNEHEAAELADATVTDRASALHLARHLSREQRSVVVTLGADGAVAWSPHEGASDAAGHAVPAVDTLGAGDVFTGVLAAELSSGSTLGDAVNAATDASAASVTVHGARFVEGTPDFVTETLAATRTRHLEEEPS